MPRTNGEESIPIIGAAAPNVRDTWRSGAPLKLRSLGCLTKIVEGLANA